MKIICVGQAAYDITLPINHFPVENKKTRINNRVECGGGSSSNCAYLLAKWGIESYFAGIVGNDYYGKKIIEEFDSIKVNRKYLQISDLIPTTASYIIANTSVGTRTIITNRDPLLHMENTSFEDDFDYMLFDGYERDICINLINRNKNAIKVLDAGSMKEATVELAHLVDYVVCSKDFAEEYTNMKVDYDDILSISRIYDKMKEEFKTNIVITLEDKGSFTYNEGYKLVPSIKTKAIDSTGAGDIYHGAFIYGISQGYDILKTMMLANIAGALSVEVIGGRLSIMPLEKVMEVYNEHNI